MSDRLWTAALLYPAPLYVGFLVLHHFSGGGIGFPLGFVLALAFGSATGFGLVRRRVWIWLGQILLIVAVVAPLAWGTSSGSGWLDLAAGVLLGSPFLWLEYAWRDGSSPTARVLALQSTFVLGVLSLAAVGVSPSVTSGSTGGQFFQGLGQVIGAQTLGISAVLGGNAPVSLPLETTFDGVYAVLGAFALLGVVLSWITPRTALDEPLPWSWGRSLPATVQSGSASEEVGLRQGQRDALATRTPSRPPETVLAPGFGSLIVASTLLVAFVALTAVEPTYALFALVVGTVAPLVAVALVLSRRLEPVGGLGG